MNRKELSASQAGEISLGNEISVHRLGYGAMRLLLAKAFEDHPKTGKTHWQFCGVLWSEALISSTRRIRTGHM